MLLTEPCHDIFDPLLIFLKLTHLVSCFKKRDYFEYGLISWKYLFRKFEFKDSGFY